MQKMKRKWLSGFLAVSLGLAAMVSPVTVLAEESNEENAPAIERFGGEDRYETAAKIAQAGWTETSDIAVLAGGEDVNLVDVLAAGPLAKQKNAPILLTKSGQTALSQSAKDELIRLEVKTVYVVAGEAVITPAVLEELEGMEIEVVELGGYDLHETAINIAKELDSFDKIVVAVGSIYADATSVSTIAADLGMPIILTETNALPESVTEYLTELGDTVTQTYVVGGPAVVSEEVLAALPHAERIYGQERYDTNMEVIKYFLDDLNFTKTYLANGEDYGLVDALVGSSLAALTASPILLIGETLEDGIKDFAKLNLAPQYAILGGDFVVPEDRISELVSVTAADEDDAVIGDAAGEKTTIEDTLFITGNNVKVQNADASYSIYVQGDNVTLSNVTVNGTLFINTGAEGTLNLQNVSAERTVKISGLDPVVFPYISGVNLEQQLIEGQNKLNLSFKVDQELDLSLDSQADAEISYFILNEAGEEVPVVNIMADGQPLVKNKTWSGYLWASVDGQNVNYSQGTEGNTAYSNTLPANQMVSTLLAPKHQGEGGAMDYVEIDWSVEQTFVVKIKVTNNEGKSSEVKIQLETEAVAE